MAGTEEEVFRQKDPEARSIPIMVFDYGTGRKVQAIALVDPDGNQVPFTLGNLPRVSSVPYYTDIAIGNIPGHSSVLVLGLNEDVDNVRETLWEVGGAYVFPDVPMGMQIVSTSDDDTVAGIGARTVRMVYLDANHEEQMETLILDGTTPVLTVATDILRVNNLHVETAGSLNEAAGDIDLMHLVDPPIYSMILTGQNVSRQTVYSVPANNTLFITAWQIGVGNSAGNRFARFELEATRHSDGTLAPGLFHQLDIGNIQDNNAVIKFDFPRKVPAKADVKISVISDSPNANAQCAGHFEGWIEV